jgi:DNA-binding PadR family transcriptional regulator
LHISGPPPKATYRTLDRLEQDGYAESHIVQQEGRPNRKEYAITDAGREELRRWLTTPLPLPPVREAWLIQIFFSYASTNDEIIQLLEARRDAIAARLQSYRTDARAAIEENARRIDNPRAAELWQITLDYGIANYEADLAWLEATIDRVRNLPSA